MGKPKKHKKPAAAKPPAKTPAVLSKRKKMIFRAVMIIIPFLFFLVLELLLRLFNYGQEIPLFKTFESNPAYYAINPQVGRRYFPSSNVTPAVAVTDIFLKQKPAQGFRVFVLGGSSAAGYPYMFNGSFSSILKVILKEYYPDKYIEIVNLAMPAVCSYTVRDIARSLADYQPDLILIYAGHNEFYGGLGVASTESLGHSRRLVNLYLGLGNYKTLQLVGDGVLLLRKSIRNIFDNGEKPTGTLMERMAQNREIPYGSDLFRKAGEIFRGNIGDVIDYSQEHHIPVMIATLVSNIRDQAPFVDVFANPQTKEQWKRQFNMAENSFQSQNYGAALQAVQRCIELDSLPASPYFLQGEIYEAAGDTSAAYRSFYRAKEFDGLRFRASELLNREIAEMGKREGVTVVPVKAAFEAKSPGRLPGKSLLLEHLHPNLDGYALMAKTFAEAIAAGNYLKLPLASPGPDSLWRSQIGVTEVDLETAKIRIDVLMRSWPFTDQAPPSKEQYHLENAGAIQNLALQFWKEEITWEQMHVQAAEYYTREKQWEKAEREYRALIQATPVNTSPYIFLGRLLMNRKKWEEALTILQQAIQYEVEPVTLKMIGSIYLLQGEGGKALVYLEQAQKAVPGDSQLQLQLAQAYALQGDFIRANEYIRQVLRSGNNNPEVQKLADFISNQLKKQAPINSN